MHGDYHKICYVKYGHRLSMQTSYTVNLNRMNRKELAADYPLSVHIYLTPNTGGEF